MDMILLAILLVMFLLRLLFLRVFDSSGNIGYLLPLALEFVFVYPYSLVAFLGLKWSYLGLSIIYLLITSLQIGFIINAKERDRCIKLILSPSLYKLTFLFLGFVIFVTITSQSNIISKLNNIGSILSMANQNAVDRYSGDLQISLLYKISTIVSFTLAFISGVMLAINSERKIKLLVFVFFLTLLFDSIIMAARAGLLLQSAAFFSSYFITKYIMQRNYFRIKLSNLFRGVFFILLLYAFFVLVQVVRGGEENFDILSISSHVLTWFIGYIPAFDIWLNSYDFNHTFGLNTFAGIVDALNIAQRQGGVYDPVVIGDNRISNIFTAYRGLIQDFSLPITVLILFLLGLLMSDLIRRVITYKSRMSYLALIMFTFFFSWSFVINPFIYNTIVIAFVLFVMIINHTIRIVAND